MDDAAEKKSWFHLEPTNGMLAPQEETVLKCSFLPTEAKQYNVQLPVFLSPPRDAGVDNMNGVQGDFMAPLPIDFNSPPYLWLRLKGLGTVPKLAFDRWNVILPTVPLGVPWRAVFNILNEGYESLD